MKPVLVRVGWIIATWFGCGKVPKGPGTAGSLGAVPLYLLVAQFGQLGVATAALVVTLVGVWAATVVARDLGVEDPQVVVVDEVAGVLVTMLPITHASWQALLAGLLLFRLFDIMKPWPIRKFEALPAGWGIVMDDVAAGIVSACFMAALRAARVLP